MRKLCSSLFILTVVMGVAMGFTADAAAQTATEEYATGEYKPGLDISFTWGWMWGGHANAYNVPATNNGPLEAGEFRWGSSQSFMITVEKPIAPWVEMQLQYTMQPSQLNWDGSGVPETRVADMTMNYWQIGTTAGIPNGRVMPFTTFTMGINYWKFSDFTTNYTIQNQSKFALTAGLGAKTYFGENQKVGVRLQFRVLPTWYNNIVTDNAGSIAFTGHAVWQWEVAAGVSVKLGN